MIYESYGPNAEVDVLDWIRHNRYIVAGRDYRVIGVERDPLVPTLVIGNPTGMDRSEQLTAESDAKQEGYSLGSAFAKICGLSATADFEALTALGMFFAQVQGYRDLRTGNSYVTGFIGGFKDEAEGTDHKRLNGPKES